MAPPPPSPSPSSMARPSPPSSTPCPSRPPPTSVTCSSPRRLSCSRTWPSSSSRSPSSSSRSRPSSSRLRPRGTSAGSEQASRQLGGPFPFSKATSSQERKRHLNSQGPAIIVEPPYLLAVQQNQKCN